MVLEKLEKVIAELELVKRDAEKTDRGNKSAGIRVRKDLVTASKSLKEIRDLVLELRKEDEKGE